MRWEFYEGHRDLWQDRCEDYNSKIERSADLMFMLGLSETIDQLTMASSVRWYGHVLMR